MEALDVGDHLIAAMVSALPDTGRAVNDRDITITKRLIEQYI
jgi:hypothetical protein